MGEDITPPSAAFDYSVPNVDSFPAPEAGEAVLFDASASSDPDGTITTYDWDFDNDASFEAQGRSAEHTYRTVGAKSPALRVTDTDGATADTSRSLTVELPGRRRKLALAQNIDDLSLLSDIEALTGEDLTGDLELSQQTLTALREAVADGTLDRSVAENAIRRLQASEEVTRNLLTRLGPAGVDGNLARQLVRKAIETVVTLIAVAISIKAGAIIGGGTVGAAATFVVDELLDAATFVLGDWLAADSEGNDGYRQQVDRQCREMSNSLVNDIKNGVVSGPAAIADAIEDIIDTLVETAADGLRTVIELDLADDIVGSVPVPQMQVLGAGEAIYGSLNQLNDSFRPDAIAGGLQGTTSGAETAIADGESVMFDAISLTSDFITNLSEITADLTSLAETVDDIINGNISARRAVFEIGAGLVTAVLKGFVGAVTGAIGAAVGGPLVAFIKTVHSQIVQSAIRGESVGFTTL